MDSPFISIIIVNWNGKHFLPDCLGSLSKISYKNIEILFVDNASKDESVSYVKKHYPKIKIIQNNANLGYAEGHEEAFKKAKGELVLLLSTDTIVEENLLDELVKGINLHEKIGAVMPKLLMYPQKHLIDSVGAFFLTSGMLYHYGREKDHTLPLYNKPMTIYSAKGACLLFRKSVLEKIGLFDKDYFAYFEETDLCHRIWLSGHEVWYWPKTKVYHIGAGTSGKLVPSFILFNSFKNRICTYLKNFSLKTLLVTLPLTLFIYQCVFILNLLSKKGSIAWSIQKAILWNITHISSTMRKRNHIQKYVRVVDDQDYLPKVMRPVRMSYYYFMFKGLRYYND
ncbi:MAG: hypothetical protein A3D74_03540 [Candidatus Levybacteria bacterium RIFCSPHIGHO2_02_FULL_37_13]|nr:MAG: hypothetical protein A3D74_03540 [Candidatus Levybacteria bacterium RIFCSPHIGHO2_02_FULL_37_13]OGH29628.1 MAG: hypothetical protein A3E40_05120 [Candidatus Levybacteria bacterium RIFCSPHIGHO2_12_FULL_37_9]OGH37982.1 MAG: hypothetical protein A3B41_04410 [Candidatus Levybacteria bacterium RIFCSPLOWO2_01_FULL_37_26]